MPSQRRQLNVRLSPEGEAMLEALAVAMRRELGINVSMSDVIQAGLSELRKKYLPDWEYSPPADAKPPRPPGRPKKPEKPVAGQEGAEGPSGQKKATKKRKGGA